MAGIYNGHLLEFPQIRVDCFTSPPSPPRPPWLLPTPSGPRPAPNAQLFLLTHVHLDHLIGLSDAFTGHIVCSPDTKRMLLRLEAEVSRQQLAEGITEEKRCRFQGLRAKVHANGTKNERVVDRIVYELGYEEGKPLKVTIILLEANHCPGSTMFLVTSPDKAILHTGDIRADRLFTQSFRRNPAVQPFIVPWPGALCKKEPGRIGIDGARRVLDRIYLDTGALLGTGDMPDREPVLQDLLQQMSLFPPNTVFFLNVWCFGWEDVVKEVARYFDEPVHVDRYKRSIYSAVQSDPYLLACTTTDPFATRFHACERRSKCEGCRNFDKDGRRVWKLDRRVVNVNMVEIKTAGWDVQHNEFLEKLGRAAMGDGPWPSNIDSPIARHSPLPELQKFVQLFRPRAISPNTVMTPVQGLDYFLLPDLFKDHLARGGYETVIRERNEYLYARYAPSYLDRLQQMQAAGMDLLACRGASDRDEHLPDPHRVPPMWRWDNMVGLGRRAGTAGQLSRNSSPSMSVGQIMSAVAKGGNDARTAVLGANISVFQPNGSRFRSDIYDAENNTDEEEPPWKRRRYGLAHELESSEGVNAEPSMPPPAQQSWKPTPTSRRRTTGWLKPCRWAAGFQASAKFEDLDRKSRSSRSVPRISLDKEHLRALAIVWQETDTPL